MKAAMKENKAAFVFFTEGCKYDDNFSKQHFIA